MTTKNVKSRLFKGSPDQLLLDERVSKIVLPTLDADRAVMDEKEGNWGLSPIEEDETEVTETLQVFIGLPEKNTASAWEISEDDNPFWDEDGDELDEVPVPMSLSLNPAAVMSQENSTQEEEVNSGLPPGLALQSIQEIHDDEPIQQTEESDDWGQIAWDDVTLSDILGDFDGGEVDDDPAGAQLVFETNTSNESNTASEDDVFPALVSLEDIPAWEESWEQDETDPIGPELNFEEQTSSGIQLNDQWFDDGSSLSGSDEMNDVQSLPVSKMPSYTNSHRPPPPRIVLKQSVGFWKDSFVQVWLMILSIALIAAIIWRILQMV